MGFVGRHRCVNAKEMQGRLAIYFYLVGIEGTTSRETSKLGEECPLVGLCVLTLEGSRCHTERRAC